MKKNTLLLLFSMLAGTAWAQSDSLSTDALMDLSLEDLMNIQVVSASKKAENLFDAPLSASVLTRDEIQKAGVNSIMEALRLMPGLVVRQTTNGNYDIHIRGLDNVPPNTLQVYSANTTTLVMIDNRPVYNYLQGGTFWESLPIDLNDVERIEVVRGPSATLYGPNAVSGVINIITRQTDKKGFSTVANAQYGSLKTSIANISLNYQFNDKLSAIVSGNYQGRGREVSYYHPVKDRFYTTPDSLTYQDENHKAPQRYPHPDRAMDKYGANLFLRYNPTDKVQLSLASGLQNSEVQNAYNPYFVSSLATSTSKTAYADLKANVYGLAGQISYLQGKQDPQMGFIGSTYDLSTLDMMFEYDLKITSNLSVKPGLNYRRAIYDDTPYWDVAKHEGTFNARTEMETYAGSVRVDYKAFNEKIRLIGGARIDRFSYPDKVFLSYQLAANYKPSESHLIRAVYSTAYRSAFIYDTYLNIEQRSNLNRPGLPAGSSSVINLIGNKDLDMLQSKMFELGYRSKLADNLSADIEAYFTTTKNYTNIIAGATVIQPGAKPSDPIFIRTGVSIQNLPLYVHQWGTTVSVNYVLKRLQLKPFVTFQTTSLHDYSMFSNTADASPATANNGKPAENNLYSGVGTKIKHQFTPGVYGGAFINYQLTQKLNVNLNPYYYSAQTFYHQDNRTYQDNVRGIEHIAPKLLLNATVSYAPVKPVSLFVTVKNLLNDSSREYYRTDQIGSMILVGASLRY